MSVLVKLNNDKEYTLSPLTVYWIERLEDIMKETAGSMSKEYKVMTDLIYQSLLRKHPELVREDLSNLIDSDQINGLFAKLLEVSQLVKPAEGEEAKK